MKKATYKVVLMLLLSLFLVLFLSTKGYCASDFDYTLNTDGKATITAYHGSEVSLTIPNKIDGHDVIAIGQHAFNENRNTTNGKILKSITISEGILTIGDFAFIDCTNLESVQLPETLMSLGDTTFLGCKKLNSINIPSQITTLGVTGSMFQETAFTEFTIPENVKKIPACTFRVCTKLQKVTVYSDDVEYGNDVFQYCLATLVLSGHEGSTTQSYAEEYGINFEVLTSTSPTTPTTPTTPEPEPEPQQTVEPEPVPQPQPEQQPTSDKKVEPEAQKTQEPSQSKTSQPTSNTKQDNTVAPGNLPKTGSSRIVLFVLAIISVIGFVFYRNYKYLKGI